MPRLDFNSYLSPDAPPEKDAATAAPPRRMRAIEQAVRHLPPLPDMMAELLAELSSGDADIAFLEERISHDPTLTTRLLRMANSAFYSPRAEIVAVGQALMILGLNTARNLVLSTAMRAVMGSSRSLPGFVEHGIFRHSVAVAVGTARLGKVVPCLRDMSDVLFVAGLLHDIGMVALQEEYARERSSFERAGTIDEASERNILGVVHTRVGRMVWEHWKLPPELEAPLLRHHEPPENLTGEPLVAAVALADLHADLRGEGLAAPRGEAESLEVYAGILGVDAKAATGVLDGLGAEVEAYMGSLG